MSEKGGITRTIKKESQRVFVGEGKGKNQAAKVVIYYDPLLCQQKTIEVIVEDTAILVAKFIAEDLTENDKKHN